MNGKHAEHLWVEHGCVNNHNQDDEPLFSYLGCAVGPKKSWMGLLEGENWCTLVW